MKKSGLLFLLFLAFLSACTDTEEIGSIDAGKEYYPLEVGSARVYKVTFKRIQQNEGLDSGVFYVRERIDTVYKNLANETTYRIVRASRQFQTDSWADDSVYTVTQTNREIRRLDNNITYLKMIFPVKTGVSWSQNMYNYLDYDSALYAAGKPQQKPRETYYKNIGQPLTVSNVNYPNTVTVETVKQPGNIFLDDRRVEVYAENVGLIFKNYNILEKCDVSECDFNPDFILRGYQRTEELISVE